MTQFTFTLVVWFFPGIICALLVENLAPSRPWSTPRFALYSFVLGFVACYLPYSIVLAAWHRQWPPPVWLLDSLSRTNLQPVSFGELLSVTAIAVLMGFFTAFVLNRHWLHRFAKSLGISRRFGDLDVWSHTFNSSDVTDAWVVVRDIKHGLAFEGWVNAFSETADDNELLLREVRVYDNRTSEPLYDVPSLYVARPRNELTIEFRSASFVKGESDAQTASPDATATTETPT